MIMRFSIACFSLATLAAAQPSGFRLETLTDQLNDACSMGFAPDGRLFVGERVTGAIRVIEDGQLVAQPWAVVPTVNSYGSEAGMLGLAVHPRFPSNGYVYSNSVEVGGGGWRLTLSRWQESGGVGQNRTPLLMRPFAGRHVGGPIAFGRDGRLYVAHGEAALEWVAQSLGTSYGKILRVEDDGSAPLDNPFVGVLGAEARIWTYGHRHPFGIAVHPRTGVAFATENGEGGGDEINRLVAGGNYGWPIYDGPEPLPDPLTEDPFYAQSRPEPVYAGGDFYAGRAFPAEYRFDLFVGEWRFGRLTRFDLDANGTALRNATTFFSSVGPVLDVASGPDGALYILHSTVFHQRGCERVSRVVWDAAPVPSVHLTAVSGQAVGGSLTVGIVGNAGEQAGAWLAFRTVTPPVALPWGSLAVPGDIVLPPITIGADDRAYYALSIPDDPALFGRTVYAQAATVAGATTITLAPPTEWTF